MDEGMTRAAVEFVNELVDLGVLRDIGKGRKVLTNAPLFVVSKDGQPGQWRVIADMLHGGQNDCVGQDPAFMPRIAHIVDQMYSGGYSAVVDLSKFFYNFPTHEDDRPYLGLLHPRTKELLAYYGLAMGAGNSPAIACRIGLAFVRLVKEKFAVFKGAAKANCYWTGLRNNGFDPKVGYGFILIGRDGGAVHIWVWVNDFLIHGPSHEKTAQGLQFFLDTAVDCGFLFHPKKLVHPQQVVKYCGFLFDTTDVPCLRIPEAKRDRALAICEYMIQSPLHKKWSRLGLAVAVGVLESLTEATPRRLGHTHLKEFHTLVHPPGLGIGAEPYYTTTALNSLVLDELKWWRQYLIKSEGRYVRGRSAATLLWKELATLKETLLRIKESPHAHQVIDSTVFYFTDNSGVYWIATTGSSKNRTLHKLISEIRLLELEPKCTLQVIHVPGKVLITQGTDGLSRGVWMSHLQNIMDPDRLAQAIFDPVPFDPALVWESLPFLSHHASHWTFQHWNQPWVAATCFHQTTVWCPPPELARQLLTFLLNSWVECPYTTSAVLFVPRVLEASWRHMSSGWTRLPISPPCGMLPKPHLRAGCQMGFRPRDLKSRLQCTFALSGFGKFRSCGACYHPGCFRAGEPFKTRRLRDEGLVLPAQAAWPNFEFDVTILRPTPLVEPPSGPEIPLMWCQEWYSLWQSRKKYDRDVQTPISFGTIRAVRSAVFQWLSLDAINSSHAAYMSADKKIVYQSCRPTDNLSFQLFAKGMVARLGDHTRPSVALLDRHVRFLDSALDQMFLDAENAFQRRELSLAGLANLTLWLRWLQSSECFGLNWEDCSLVEPADHAVEDLPTNCGIVTFRLNPVTKSDRARTADVIIVRIKQNVLYRECF
ncbi:unnamed protein product [Cylindrotheca closterium]|uniref:Reverse transcriptase domain-containing protein n=1 Tax=Cylindrotheca closterium TaxID=2856 RepID=A0AAD2GCL9_9STRA|nr:unnamed protein product [Cylindrotheca closterium]